MSVKELTEIV